jgi:hypothetical protein
MKRVSNSLPEAADATARTATRNSLVAVLVLIAFLMPGTLLIPASASGTSVVALIDKTNHRTVIAADCRVNQRSASISECKIIEEPGCTVAIAGLYLEDTTAFNLRRLVAAACRHPGDLREKAEAFLRFSKRLYEAAVRHIRETDLNDYKQTIENKPTEVIFAGLLAGHLALLVRGFVSGPDGKITTERYESSDTPDSSIGYIAGLNRRIREEVKSHSQWERSGYTEAARRFVEIEINANPDLAGPPISELEVDNLGTVHWISRGACDNREAD